MKKANRIIQRLLIWAQSSNYDIVIPNYFYGRYEMDVFKMSKSMIVTEFEIKVSKRDFQKDFEKGNGLKHERLKQGVGLSPNRFFFVIPSDLLGKIIVPKHLGLIVWNEAKHPEFEIVQHAKIIHNQKASTDMFRRLIQTLAVREQIYREKYFRAKQLIKPFN